MKRKLEVSKFWIKLYNSACKYIHIHHMYSFKIAALSENEGTSSGDEWDNRVITR